MSLSTVPGASRTPDDSIEHESLKYTGHLIRRAQQLHAALWNREVSATVSSVQFATLAVLARRPRISQRELGQMLDLDRSTIADLLARMQRRGVVTREQATDDRRRYELSLTDQGAEELIALRPGVERVEAFLTEPLTAPERVQLRQRLEQVLLHAVASGTLDGPGR